MNRFPYRKKRKGKRPPLKDIGVDGFNSDAVHESKREDVEARSETGGDDVVKSADSSVLFGTGATIESRYPQPNRGDANNASGQSQPRNLLAAESSVGNKKQGKNTVESNQTLTGGTSDSGHKFDRNQSRAHSKKNNKMKGGGDQFLRNLRAPIKQVPEVSYQPKTAIITDKTTNNKSRPSLRSQSKSNKFKSDQQGLYAALDLGTNNCRLLIAQPQERNRFRVIDGYSKIVRLGEGLGHSGSLRQDAMDRAVGALKICSEKLKLYNIKRHRLIATEACRQADNGELFLDRVKRETGLDLEIITRQTEASLAAEGCGALMDRKADAGVLFDIGGGSSELMLVNRRLGPKRISDQIVSWTSLPVGVVTLSERFGGKTVTRESFKAMVREVLDMLEAFEGRHELARIWKNGRVHLLGTSGTVTTLAGIHLELPRYDRRKVDGLWLSDQQIDNVLEDLLSMDYKQRALSPCVGKERADLVMAGCAILEAIRITWPAKRLRVADRGLREGILTQMMDRDGAWIRSKKDRWSKKRQNKNHKNALGNENGS